MFDLGQASTIEYSMPSWQGATQYIGGLFSGASGAVYSTAKAVVDPVAKNVHRVQNQASLLYNQGVSGAWSTLENILTAKNDAVDAFEEKVTSTGSTILAPIVSGTKWVVIIAGIGIAIYVLAVIGPFLPKPSYGRK